MTFKKAKPEEIPPPSQDWADRAKYSSDERRLGGWPKDLENAPYLQELDYRPHSRH